MNKNITNIEHLNRIRPKSHKTLIKNGHFKKMAKLSVISRKKKLSTSK